MSLTVLVAVPNDCVQIRGLFSGCKGRSDLELGLCTIERISLLRN